MIDLTPKTFSSMPVTLDMLASMTLEQLIEVCLTDPAHINGGDPRTASERDQDIDAAEWRETYASLI